MALKINGDILIDSINKSLKDLNVEYGVVSGVGHYLKFSNGVLICWGKVTTGNYDTSSGFTKATWNYPKNFINIPHCYTSANDWSTYVISTKVFVHETYCNIMGHAINPYQYTLTNKNIEVYILAIGKWK